MIAGDTVLIADGTYDDEHVVFSNTGSSGSPIVFEPLEDGYILDGLNNTGIAIRITDKSYIHMSGFTLKNYDTGIKGYGLMEYLHFGDFTICDIADAGIEFDGASLQNSIITDFTITDTGGNAVSHFDYSSSDCHDVEIRNFLIRDISGEGFNWRNTCHLHIHNGEVYNTASDGVHLQLSVDSSIVEYVRVDTTGWHGIAIHDHTVGDYPCHDNIIRNCRVNHCPHNAIDLHSGAFNTVVEACTLICDENTGGGIYFHNLGDGLIARHNLIYGASPDNRLHGGIKGGPSTGCYLRNILIENNTIYNVVSGISFSEATENITARDNVIYEALTEISISSCGATLLERNEIDNGICRVNTDGETDVLDMIDQNYDVRSSWGALLTVGYTEGRVFERELTYHHGDYTLTSPYCLPTGSRFFMESTSEPGYNGIIVHVNTFNMMVIPDTDSLEVLVDEWETSGSYYKKWREICESPSVVTSHSIGDCQLNSWVDVIVNDLLYSSYFTGSSGWFSFDYTDGFENDTVTFEINTQVGIQEEGEAENPQNAFELFQNEPNPFCSSSTKIVYSVPSPGMVELTIFDLAGRSVRSLLASDHKTGCHSVIWDGFSDDNTRLSAGIYLYVLRTGSNIITKKLTLIR
ncbi:MAG: right-handed parallel beta-helix repeat-containing protein [Candidatus Sabulitectum sp.]|nr:right-handed parallel beta-helix repeat-containing protein [Candidatus Sabulitectum sp.]